MARSDVSYAIPPARTFETRYSIIWERQGRWIIRRRAETLRGRVFGYGCIGVFVAGFPLIALGVRLGSMNLICLALLAMGFIGLGLTSLGMNRSAGPSSVIDWARGTIKIGDEEIALGKIQEIRVGTTVVTRTNIISIIPDKWQVWTMSLIGGGLRSRIWIASYPEEDMLLAAAKKLATQLNVPVHVPLPAS